MTNDVWVGVAVALGIVALCGLLLTVLAIVMDHRDAARHRETNALLDRQHQTIRGLIAGYGHHGDALKNHTGVLRNHAELLDELRPNGPPAARPSTME